MSGSQSHRGQNDFNSTPQRFCANLPAVRFLEVMINITRRPADMIIAANRSIKTHFFIVKSKKVFTSREHPDKAGRRVKSGGRFVGKTKHPPLFSHRSEIKGAGSLKKFVLPLVLFVCAQPATTTLRSQSGSPPPNIVVILADDLGYGDVSFNGCPEYSTPNIDSLASSGIWCSNGYVTHRFCSPSAALLTGLYQQRFGHENQLDDDASNPRLGLPMRELLLPQILKPAGYVCGAIGKCHLGTAHNLQPLQRGFDEFFRFPRFLLPLA